MVSRRVSPQKILKTYKELGSTVATAKRLGVSRHTVSRHLKVLGVVLKKGRKKGSQPHNKKQHSGCLPQWLREHPHAELPRSPKKIAELTGCSKDAVRTYLYRRRNQVLVAVGELPWLKSAKVMLTSVEGYMIPGKDIFRVESIVVDPYTFRATVSVQLRSGAWTTFEGSKDEFYKEFFTH